MKLSQSLWKLGALTGRHFLDEISYRFSFFLEAGVVVFYTLTFYFISRVVSGGSSQYLAKYGGDYFSFVLIGLALFGLLNSCMMSFTETIRDEQMMGTLEIILSTPTPIRMIFASRLVWSAVHGCFEMAGYFIIGIFVLSASYSGANLSVVPLIMLLSIGAFAAIGMISAGFILVYKKGDPINIFLGFATAFLGGVYYPVEVMPRALQAAAQYIPITYTLRLMREACINGAEFSAMSHDILVLAGMCAILMLIGIAVFTAALRRARREGTIAQY